MTEIELLKRLKIRRDACPIYNCNNNKYIDMCRRHETEYMMTLESYATFIKRKNKI